MTSIAELVRPATLHRGLPRFAEGSSVTVGVFDGIHRGHARVIGKAVDVGRRRGLRVRLVTFDPHPAQIVGPRRDVSRLTSLEQRAELAGALGVDDVVVLPFTPALARLSPAEFVSDVLHGALRAEVVTVGGNFTFGHRGRGGLRSPRQPGRPARGR